MSAFRRVLVANRGEIACRIERTLRAMGISPVAVHSEADVHARHVTEADDSVLLGPPAPVESYLRVERVVDAALSTGCQAVHPGYGLLAEDPALAEACAAAGITFIGPSPRHLRDFGRKDTARALAADHGVPILPGSGLLADVGAAVAAAEATGWPVMLKATAGGGGIGMRRCDDADALRAAFEGVTRQAASAFGEAGLIVERYVAAARHIEVQVFGDGHGRAVALGERDCTVQRRHQKVIEESPAPGLPVATRDALVTAASRLLGAVGYASAGTVEFVVDATTGEGWFLEVNTRLQVEHGVTELRYGIDLVEWMVRLAAGEPLDDFATVPEPSGHAIEVRCYAEDPADGHRPSAGLLTEVVWPAGDGVRVDAWVEPGTDVTPWYDPLLGKVLTVGPTRDDAVATMAGALAGTRLAGVETNVRQLREIVAHPDFVAGTVTTSFLDGLTHLPPSVVVVEPGTFTTVQDLPGRLGYWDVGVPPSGPMDDRSFALANGLVGNEPGAAGLETTATGPTLRFRTATLVALGGAQLDADLDGAPVPWWTSFEAPAGSTLRLGAVEGPGIRSYVAFGGGGLDVPEHLGSRSTFVLGGFGGHAGRTLRPGDVLHLRGPADGPAGPGATLPPDERPHLTDRWELGVLAGPHGAPDFFTDDDIAMLHTTEWEVHYHSDRTGVRLLGPAPTWARPDGGEAGLHPSNIHDNAYAVGTVDFTGDMPILLGPDGPSCGGFVCPATVATAERWKLGQLRAGDHVRFVPLTYAEATAPVARSGRRPLPDGPVPEDPVLFASVADGDRPRAVYRRDGDDNVLLEYGPNVLDLELRLRVATLMDHLRVDPPGGLCEMVPGIRSLQVRFDPSRTDPDRLVADLVAADDALPASSDLEVPGRIVWLPLSWDDPATREATERYMHTVRADAPWCPWNIEFIRRINGLDSTDEVRDIVFDAHWLVLALGDVYLGAPVATPVDPRHRLVTTKYNPARTWTAENSVGIGGAYLCIYGMEGPGGYQFVGRTVQVWNRWRTTDAFSRPWLLRSFDQIRWYPVEADELLALRADFPHGRVPLRIEPTTFRVVDHRARLAEDAASIRAFTERRDRAFAEERARWEAAGLSMDRSDVFVDAVPEETPVPTGSVGVRSPVAGAVWRVEVVEGQQVTTDDVLFVLETMKMETAVMSPTTGRVQEVRVAPGSTVSVGRVLAVVEP